MKRGLHIVLLGPDGCGKSTLLPLLQARLAGCFTGAKIHHWRPRILSEAGVAIKARKATEGPTVDPHAHPPHSPLISFARLCYYLLDYWLGAPALWRAKRERMLVVYDRYAPDMAVDPRRYRFRLPRFLLNVLSFCTPQPDFGFILLADPNVLYQRKHEVPLAAVKELVGDYRRLSQRSSRYVEIDCDRPPEEVAEAIVQYLKTHLSSESDCH